MNKFKTNLHQTVSMVHKIQRRKQGVKINIKLEPPKEAEILRQKITCKLKYVLDVFGCLMILQQHQVEKKQRLGKRISHQKSISVK